MIDIELRLNTPADESFIYDSWLKSYQEQNRDFKRMGIRTYYAGYKKILMGILDSALVVIACNPDDKDQIYGFIVAEADADIVHYLYVKYTFRKLGIARRLLLNVHPELREKPLIHTFANPISDKKQSEYLLTYNPFLR